MKILMCNSFYYPRGGSERYMFELTHLLEGHGHEVIPFSMAHENNLPSRYSDYFVSYIDYPKILKSRPGPREMWRVFERLFISNEAQKKVRKLIQDTRPDIAHVHGIGREFSPAILQVIKSAGIPIVQTLHDYGMLCPNTNFYSHGEVCERCKPRRYYNAVLRRCKRDSLSASLLACVSQYSMTLHNYFGKNVDVFISPSNFLHKKLVEYGFNKKVVIIPNFIDLRDYPPPRTAQRYCLFAGRLIQMKGIWTLIEAARLIPQVPIYIAGEGELLEETRRVVNESHLENVHFFGYMRQPELVQLMVSSDFTIFPSENYENFPMSIIESKACGKAIIASDIGGLPEMIRNGWNGLLFKPGDAGQLAERINYLFNNPEKAAEMGRHGRQKMLTDNTPETHYQMIMQIYQDLVSVYSDKLKG